MNKHYISFVFMITLVGLYFGCTSTQRITKRSQLANPLETGTITVLTKEGTRYELPEYRLTDSTLIGRGSVEREGTRSPFGGSLKLTDIGYVKTQNASVGKTLINLGAIVFFAATAYSYMSAKEGLSVQEQVGHYYPSTGGGGGCEYGCEGSCPFIYTYDGGNFFRESETFAGAVFRGAERVSYDRLNHLRPVDGKCFLRITNERPETEYVNEIKLIAVDAPPEVSIIPDGKGSIHSIAHPVMPIRCVDFDGRDVLDKVLNKDSTMWESIIATNRFARDEDFRDGSVIEFPKPRDATIAKLVVDGVNTDLGIFAFDQLMTLKGSDKLRWYQSLENNPVEGRKLINFMLREGMLQVLVWEVDQWVKQASLFDVGPNVPKSQVAVLDIRKCSGDVVKVKLESATDLWRIDQVYLDYSTDVAVEARDLALESAMNDSNVDVAHLIRGNDTLYYTTIPGQYALLSFDDVPGKAGMARSYIVKSKGYYHQWFEHEGKDQAALLDRVLTEPLLGSKIFMPLWKKLKE
jgi:hypothetical protein